MDILLDDEHGLMLSALLVFAGMVDFIIITLFLERKQPRMREHDMRNPSPEWKQQIALRIKRYKLMQFCLAMTGLLLIVAGLYGISMQAMRMFQ